MLKDEAAVNDLARAAVAGDHEALDRLMAFLRDDIYHLALRTLGHPADAEDAAQEALIQILTARRRSRSSQRRSSGPASAPFSSR